ncbi:MAG: hypothetical protein DI563_22495 [Variovorax paradoxus]|uniref:Uncharacterized protein n=1 Tax=Variovorax paradoxus TaxID=34073 RepID=A0A2W5PQ59_VARPD|nr:MAG: hypothetical protein DI563_22495 [Variovorax paradoxus]
MDLWKHYRLTFHLNTAPPAATAIARVRQRASPDRLQRVLALGTGAGLLGGLVPVVASEAAWGWVLLQALLLAIAIALPIFYWVRIADLLATAARPLGAAEARVFATWAARDEAVGRYWVELVGQRRAAVYGDYAALVTHAARVTGQAPASNSDLHRLAGVRHRPCHELRAG